MNRTFRTLLAVSALLPIAAHAALVVDAPAAAGVQLHFDAHPTQEVTLGPVSLTASNGSQVVFTAATNGGAAGFTGDLYGLSTNGIWNNTRTYAWQNGDLDGGRTATMTFTFAAPVSAVGGFMNYVPSFADSPYYTDSDFVLMALGRDGTVLEEYALADVAPIVTPNGFNAGEYRGISRGTADIYAFEIQGAGVVQYLDLAPAAAVPESSNIAMLLAGLGLLGVALRRRRRN